MLAEEYLPHQVESHELIVRAVKSPFHVTKGGSLKKNAFDPPPGSNELSVIRLGIGIERVRNRSIGIANSKNSEYRGLAAAGVAEVRGVGAEVVCDQVPFAGHANIVLPVGRPARDQEPPEPSALKQQDSVRAGLLSNFRYFSDPDPSVDTWTGDVVE